jgi:hypothetical protein
MRFALIAAVILSFVGCAPERPQPLPTAPSPSVATTPTPSVPSAPDPPAPPRRLTFLCVVVTGDTLGGGCIYGARVEIVRGQGIGRSLTQTDPGCSYWDPDHNANFYDLNEGEELTLRASASGYVAKEVTVVAPPADGQRALSIVLSKIQ